MGFLRISEQRRHIAPMMIVKQTSGDKPKEGIKVYGEFPALAV